MTKFSKRAALAPVAPAVQRTLDAALLDGALEAAGEIGAAADPIPAILSVNATADAVPAVAPVAIPAIPSHRLYRADGTRQTFALSSGTVYGIVATVNGRDVVLPFQLGAGQGDGLAKMASVAPKWVGEDRHPMRAHWSASAAGVVAVEEEARGTYRIRPYPLGWSNGSHLTAEVIAADVAASATLAAPADGGRHVHAIEPGAVYGAACSVGGTAVLLPYRLAPWQGDATTAHYGDVSPNRLGKDVLALRAHACASEHGVVVLEQRPRGGWQVRAFPNGYKSGARFTIERIDA